MCGYADSAAATTIGKPMDLISARPPDDYCFGENRVERGNRSAMGERQAHFVSVKRSLPGSRMENSSMQGKYLVRCRRTIPSKWYFQRTNKVGPRAVEDIHPNPTKGPAKSLLGSSLY